MTGYSASDVARMLDVPVARLRSYARNGLLDPARGSRGEYRFTFHDLVLLRTAEGLRASRIPPRRIRRALARLREQLPSGRSLASVRIAARGDRIVVRDGRTTWQPESGQACFDFEVAELVQRAAPLSRSAARRALDARDERDAQGWYELGCESEAAAPEEAAEAYRRALALEPGHAKSHVNLGRLLHEAGRADDAERHYRRALDAEPDDPTARFNLGVSLEDRGAETDAVRAYESALDVNPELADAHFNLARLHERAGRAAAAVRHYSAYRRLTRDRPLGN